MVIKDVPVKQGLSALLYTAILATGRGGGGAAAEELA